MFAAYFPKVHQFYSSKLDSLLQHSPFLQRIFEKSIFSAMTVNFGPTIITHPHTDLGNLAWGQCVVTSCREFNTDLGGHLVFWDLGLVVRFPPGSTILLPSAILLHSNIKIQEGETWYSVTQYTAGGLLRWVYNGFCSDKSLLAGIKKKGRAEELLRWESDRESHFQEGLEMFTKVDEFTC
jgi:hypothetical protein